MTSRIDQLISALFNGGTTPFEPHSRMESYLIRYIKGGGTEGLPTPTSRIDVQLYELIKNGGAGSGGTYVPEEDVATNEEVMALINEVFGSDPIDPVVPAEAVATDDEVLDVLDTIFDSEQEITKEVKV